MEIGLLDLADDEAYALFHAAYRRAHPEDFDEPWNAQEKRTNLASDAYAEHIVLVLGDGPDVVGGATISLPLLDNQSLAYMHVFVVPEQRRRGYGTRLLRDVERIVGDHGRLRLFAEATWSVQESDEAAAGFQFARQHGFGLDLLDAVRELRLPANLPAADFRDGYRPVAWRTCPAEWLDAYAGLRALLLQEAPSGEIGLENEYFDAVRVRHEEERWREQGRRGQTVAALSPAGELVGHTQIVVPDHGDTVYQWDTLVLPAHRGHGLGIAMKVAALHEAADLVAGFSRMTTWNAASNAPMIAVNEAMGYRQVAWAAELMKDLA